MSETESSALRFPTPPAISREAPPDARKVGMLMFFVSEAAFFSTLLTGYIIYIGQSRTGPTPEVLSLPLAIVDTICLLASSFTVHRAEASLRAGNQTAFKAWWSLTIVLGTLFLLGTAYEWHDLISVHHLTISRNLFGTTFYTLIGFHAAHVTVGVLLLILILVLVWRGKISGPHPIGVQLISWYWHFVDGVWVVVFTVVYLIGR